MGRLLVSVIVVVGIGAILMNFQPVRQIGGLIASAGVAGVIAELAAQKSLSTIIAGLQIAITQPMRINDVVIVEREWASSKRSLRERPPLPVCQSAIKNTG